MTSTNGLCKCGCGHTTTIAKRNHTKYKWIKGKHLDYCKGHATNNKPNLFRRKKKYTGNIGYFQIKVNEEWVYEYRYIAEQVLGRKLWWTEIVHHIDGNGYNNKNNNLIICQDQSFHRFLHSKNNK